MPTQGSGNKAYIYRNHPLTMLRFSFFSSIIFWLSSGITAQTTEIDSLFTALAQHRAANDQVEECVALRQISGLIYASGDYDRAMAYADSALAVLPPGRPDLEHHLNYIQYSIAAQQWYAYPEEHLKLLDTAYQHLAQLEDPELEIPFLNYYGFQLSDFGYQDKAFPLLDRVELLARNHPDQFDDYLLDSYDRQLDLHKNAGNYAAGTRAFRKARDLWRDREPNDNTVSLWNNYAAILWSIGDQGEARQAMRHALDDAYIINDSTSIVGTLTSTASSYLNTGELDTVPVLLEQAKA
ncbi:MAG: hypothetical protein AAF597_13170, partial [Bacteroidota bacterium]